MHLHTVYVNTDDADDPTPTVLSILFTYPFDVKLILIDNVPLLSGEKPYPQNIKITTRVWIMFNMHWHQLK